MDDRLAHARYLVGATITQADIRLWVRLVRLVRLVRHAPGPGDRATLLDRHEFPHLWDYARELYRVPAFRDGTDAGYRLAGTLS